MRSWLHILVMLIALVAVICGVGCKRDQPKQSLFDRALGGDRYAQVDVGFAYSKGEWREKNLPPPNPAADEKDEALGWFRRAAEQGYDIAQLWMGLTLHVGGLGNTNDFPEAAKWYRKAAEQGAKQAYLPLGKMYRAGEGVPRNFTEAIKWLSLAGEQNEPSIEEGPGGLVVGFRGGDAEAQFLLGEMYYRGNGVPRSASGAYRWFSAAAENGLVEACYRVGLMTESGDGVQRDHSQSIRWLARAVSSQHEDAQRRLREQAERDDTEAQWALGMATAYGQRRNREEMIEALKWLIVAEKRGREVPDEARLRLVVPLRSAGLNQAIQQAHDFVEAKKKSK